GRAAGERRGDLPRRAAGLAPGHHRGGPGPHPRPVRGAGGSAVARAGAGGPRELGLVASWVRPATLGEAARISLETLLARPGAVVALWVLTAVPAGFPARAVLGRG